ncbi:putative T7SS-secreted protein [Streptomyces sp. NPDC047123]|uniref:putative T7SS-secreted protein n=1 Tax=Streptomyces sp. NPDC047123 TaxID=3155622 RepID=UPI0033C8922E
MTSLSGAAAPGRGDEHPEYPALGFNPAPGDGESVKALHRRLVRCARVLDDTHDVVTKLMDGSYWEGDAAVAYREQLQDGPLPKNLQNAANSIDKAARQLARWHGELEDFRSRAKSLNKDARDAREALRRAKDTAGAAGRDPDLDGKEGKAHDSAKRALVRADARVEEAEAALERILGKARRLAHEHEEKAGRRAAKIRDATDKLAPQEPGWFESALEWAQENLPDILSTIAAVIGLTALLVVSGGTAAAVLLLVAGALSATAFTVRVTQNADLWASLKDGFTKGELDQDFWSNLVTVGGDALGALPGLGAVAKGGTVAARGMGEAMPLAERLVRVGGGVLEGARSISRLDNALLASTIRGARAAPVIQKVQFTSALLGVVTAGTGLGMKMADIDDEGITGSAVAGVDGTRLGLDGGGVVDLARHVFAR